MMRHPRLSHQFVHFVPKEPEAGVLYVSIEYTVAVHLCCCGCGEKIVTPIDPGGWKLTFDGETVSLRPSIGNWQLPCRSHYVIDRNEALEAAPWEDYSNQDRRNHRPVDLETVVKDLRDRKPNDAEPRSLWRVIRERLFGRDKN